MPIDRQTPISIVLTAGKVLDLHISYNHFYDYIDELVKNLIQNASDCNRVFIEKTDNILSIIKDRIDSLTELELRLADISSKVQAVEEREKAVKDLINNLQEKYENTNERTKSLDELLKRGVAFLEEVGSNTAKMASTIELDLQYFRSTLDSLSERVNVLDRLLQKLENERKNVTEQMAEFERKRIHLMNREAAVKGLEEKK